MRKYKSPNEVMTDKITRNIKINDVAPLRYIDLLAILFPIIVSV